MPTVYGVGRWSEAPAGSACPWLAHSLLGSHVPKQVTEGNRGGRIKKTCSSRMLREASLRRRYLCWGSKGQQELPGETGPGWGEGGRCDCRGDRGDPGPVGPCSELRLHHWRFLRGARELLTLGFGKITLIVMEEMRGAGWEGPKGDQGRWLRVSCEAWGHGSPPGLGKHFCVEPYVASHCSTSTVFL